MFLWEFAKTSLGISAGGGIEIPPAPLPPEPEQVSITSNGAYNQSQTGLSRGQNSVIGADTSPATDAVESPPEDSVIQRVQDKQGRISLLDNAMPIGVIDNEYEFKKADWNHLNLKRGQNILYSAFYETESAKWLVTDLKPSLSEEEVVVNERAKYRTLIYKVVQKRDLQNSVIVGPGKNKNRQEDQHSFIEISQDLLPEDSNVFPVQIGDWLTIKLEANVSDDTEVDDCVSSAKIISVDWTDRMVSECHVKKYEHELCIDGIISFSQDVVEGQRVLRNNDKVRVLSVASNQGHRDCYPKRALAVSLISTPKSTSRQNQNEPVVDDEWEEEDPSAFRQDREFDELFREKWGVRISPNKYISFKEVRVGQTWEIPVTIRNTGDERVVLKKVHIPNFQDVSKFQVHFEGSSNGEGQSSEECPMLTLESNSTFTFKISSSPAQLGRTKELCLFDFGDFKIGRWLVVTAVPTTDDISTLLQNSDVRNGNSCGDGNWKGPSKSRQDVYNSALQQKHLTTISGPSSVRSPFFIANRINRNPVPREFRAILRNEDEQGLKLMFKNVNWDRLDAENYTDRFHVALWFEELENEVIRRTYDMYNVIMEPCSSCELMFRVPGLKEIHPPVLQGDHVMCLYSETNSRRSQNRYKGMISRIVFPDDHYPQCFVKFDEGFYRDYCMDKQPVTVQFCQGRTPYMRAHFAIDQAMQELGRGWLFPKSIILKTPRIQFVEDNQDNIQPVLTNKILIERNKGKHDGTNENAAGHSSRIMDKRAKNIFGLESLVELPSNTSYGKLRWYNPMLNVEQKNAVRRILMGQGRPLPYIIFGPPGTGKTVTVVEAILQIYFMETTSRILVTVPSNAGADLIAEHLIATNRFVPGDLVRLNGFLRSEVLPTDSIADFCVDGENLESVARHRLIISTVTTAGQFFQLHLNTGHFSHVFLDEAGYCTEPEALIAAVLTAVNKEGQLILAGDPKQLGPVLISDLELNAILEKSFLERLMETSLYSRDTTAFPSTKYNPAMLTKLVRSYRSHELLLKLPSQKFYSDELISLANYEDSHLLCEKELDFLPRKGVPLIFHGVQGHCIKEEGSNSQSWYNLAEMSQIVHYVRKLKNCGVQYKDIGIITPYRKQVEKIKQSLQLFLLEDDLPKVASVQEFQGGERKVMIISTVRTAGNDDLLKKNLKENKFEFLCSEKRFNVAVTRAKALMIIVGDPHLLYCLPCWTDYIKYALEMGVYVGCDKPRELDSKKLQDFLKNLPS